jgi:hypothetical protein
MGLDKGPNFRKVNKESEQFWIHKLGIIVDHSEGWTKYELKG